MLKITDRIVCCLLFVLVCEICVICQTGPMSDAITSMRERLQHAPVDQTVVNGRTLPGYAAVSTSVTALTTAHLVNNDDDALPDWTCLTLFQVFNVAKKEDTAVINCGKSSAVAESPWTVMIKVTYNIKLRNDKVNAKYNANGDEVSTGFIIHTHYVLGSRHSLPLGILEKHKMWAWKENGGELRDYECDEDRFTVVITAGYSKDKNAQPQTRAIPDLSDIKYYEPQEFVDVQTVNAYLGLAMLRVDEPFLFLRAVQPVCLPAFNGDEETSQFTSCFPKPEELQTAVGFGDKKNYEGQGKEPRSLPFVSSYKMKSEEWSAVYFEDKSKPVGKKRGVRGARNADHGAVITGQRYVTNSQGERVERSVAFSMITYPKFIGNPASKTYREIALEDGGVMGINLMMYGPWIANNFRLMELKAWKIRLPFEERPNKRREKEIPLHEKVIRKNFWKDP